MLFYCQVVFTLALSLETSLCLRPHVIKFNYLVKKTRSTQNPDNKIHGCLAFDSKVWIKTL